MTKPRILIKNGLYPFVYDMLLMQANSGLVELVQYVSEDVAEGDYYIPVLSDEQVVSIFGGFSIKPDLVCDSITLIEEKVDKGIHPVKLIRNHNYPWYYKG